MLNEVFVVLTDSGRDWIDSEVQPFEGLLCCSYWHCRQQHMHDLQGFIEDPETTAADILRRLPAIGENGPATVEPDTETRLKNAFDELQVDAETADRLNSESFGEFMDEYGEDQQRKIAARFGELWELAPAPAGPVVPFVPDDEQVEAEFAISEMGGDSDAVDMWRALEHEAEQLGRVPTRAMLARTMVGADLWPTDTRGAMIGLPVS